MKDRETSPARLDSASPARYAGYGSLLAGVILFGFGGYLLLASDMPRPLSIAFLITGFLESMLGWFCLRRLRVAWAFACSLNGTALVTLLFGAPKIRDSFDVSIAAALVPSFVFGVLLMLYILGREDF